MKKYLLVVLGLLFTGSAFAQTTVSFDLVGDREDRAECLAEPEDCDPVIHIGSLIARDSMDWGEVGLKVTINLESDEEDDELTVGVFNISLVGNENSFNVDAQWYEEERVLSTGEVTDSDFELFPGVNIIAAVVDGIVLDRPTLYYCGSDWYECDSEIRVTVVQ